MIVSPIATLTGMKLKMKIKKPQLFKYRSSFMRILVLFWRREGLLLAIRCSRKAETVIQRCFIKKEVLKETLVQVLFLEFCKTFKNSLFIDHLRWLLLERRYYDHHRKLWKWKLFHEHCSLKNSILLSKTSNQVGSDLVVI